MKKYIYIFFITLSCSIAFTACTEEEVTPSTEIDNGGGRPDDKI